jgi:hypothetical protein
MIERVAQAIYAKNAASAAGRLPWAKAQDATKESVRDLALAAIGEMREPTEAMGRAAEEIVVGYDDFVCGDGNIYLAYPEYYDKAKHVWQSLIDAALKEETP